MIRDDEDEVDDCGRIGIWGGGIDVYVDMRRNHELATEVGK